MPHHSNCCTVKTREIGWMVREICNHDTRTAFFISEHGSEAFTQKIYGWLSMLKIIQVLTCGLALVWTTVYNFGSAQQRGNLLCYKT
jgi:hypothetical protein